MRRLALEEERGFTDAQWDEIAGLGWPELALRDSGLGIVELAVVAEELGYACAPTPLSSTWAAALLLDAAGEGGGWPTVAAGRSRSGTTTPTARPTARRSALICAASRSPCPTPRPPT